MKEKIQIPTTKFHKALNALCIVVLAVTLIIIGMSYGDLPDKIPTHYNFAGEIDGWGNKSGIWMMLPISSLLVIGPLVFFIVRIYAKDKK